MVRKMKSYVSTALLVAAGVILVLGAYIYQFVFLSQIALELLLAISIIGVVLIVIGVYIYVAALAILYIWKRINLVMQRQLQNNWCWAAVTASVSAYFNSNTTWTQCTIVNAELGLNECCTQGSSANCDRPWTLDGPLTRTGNFVSMSSGAGAMNDVRQELDNNRPLCARIGWSGGGGHFVAIDGYNTGLDMIAVDDPWSGASDVALSVFQTSYLGSGSWTHSYRVCP